MKRPHRASSRKVPKIKTVFRPICNLTLFSVAGREIQKKWKALKDAYFRSLRTQTVKSGSGASKKRPYPFQQQMSFLQPVTVNRQTSGNMIVEEDDVSAIDIENDQQSEDHVPPVFKKPKSKTKKETFETQLLEILKSEQTANQSSGSSEDDDNKMFLLSLLPKMRLLSEDASFEFRIKVMQCLQECCTKSKMLQNGEPQQHHSTRPTPEIENRYDEQRDTFSPTQKTSSPPAGGSNGVQPHDWEEGSEYTILNVFNVK